MNNIEDWLQRAGRLAVRLRTLRDEAGLTGQALAESLGPGWTQPRISKIENGKQPASAEDVEAFARACGANEGLVQELLAAQAEAEALHSDWKQRRREGQPKIQASYNDLAKNASVIRNAEALLIPGLLQTPGYARAMAMQNVLLNDHSPDDIEATVIARMRRQEVLYDSAKTFEFVITEAALHHAWCPPAEMRNQLDRLISSTIERPNLWFGIIPFQSAQPPRCVVQSQFIMFDDLVVVESYRGEDVFRGEGSQRFGQIMDLLKDEAVTSEAARTLIVRAMEDLRRES